MRRALLLSKTPEIAAFAVLAALFVLGGAMFDHFASIAVVRNLLVDNAFLAVAAIGATFVILAGGIDLSVGSVMACVSVLAATLIERSPVHPVWAMMIALGAAGVFGCLQGVLIAFLDVPPFLVTLAGLFFARGAAFAISPQSLALRHEFIATTMNETLTITIPVGAESVAIPSTVPIVGLVLGWAWLVLRHTRFGRSVYSVGDDAHAAALMGLAVRRARVCVYVISGLCSGLAGLLFMLYQQAGDPAACKGLELDAIAAVVIGGTLLRGGVGSVVGSMAGVLILGLIQTIIAFQGNLSSWWARIVSAALVLAFLCLHQGLARFGRSRR